MASRREFVTALKRELPAALRDLQSGNIAPVDLAQAAIGPGMAVFSRYAKVLETSGDRMGVRTALALINQVLDEVLAEQEGEYDADTRWCIKWFEQYAHNDGPYGDAETLCKAMAVGVNGLVETGVVAAKSGKVRLFKRADLMGGKPETWDPAKDDDILHWEVCQYLCWALETGGEQAAADLLRRINAVYAGAAEVARDLAYRLYTVCERKKWAGEAIAYNALVVSWPEIQKLAGQAAVLPTVPGGLFQG
jgi:putative DNA methylase